MVVSCSGVATRECVGAWTGGTRAQAGHLAPARSERAENPPGLTGRARVTPLLYETDDRTGLSRRHTRCTGHCRAAAVRDSWCAVPSEAVARRDHSANGRVVLVWSCQGGLTARRAEARGTVTRMGRDRASGLGSAKPTRARSVRTRPLPRTRIKRMVRRCPPSLMEHPAGTRALDFRDRPWGESLAVKAGSGECRGCRGKPRRIARCRGTVRPARFRQRCDRLCRVQYWPTVVPKPVKGDSYYAAISHDPAERWEAANVAI